MTCADLFQPIFKRADRGATYVQRLFIVTAMIGSILGSAPPVHAQKFPDDCAGWTRIDSVTYFESTATRSVSAGISFALDYGMTAMTRVTYGRDSSRLRIESFSMQSTEAAFGLFSAMITDTLFNGIPGNAAVHSDSSVIFNFGSYCVSVVRHAGSERPPQDFMNRIYDVVTPISDNEAMRIPLSIDERKVGSERFIRGENAWLRLCPTALKDVMPIVQSTAAYRATFTKDYLDLRRTVIAFVAKEEQREQLLTRLIEHYGLKQLEKKTALVTIRKATREDAVVYLVATKRTLFLALTSSEDSGAEEWLRSVFGN